jgi:ADP-L-glycero-D-manno-heptose 6-epimerase
VDDRAIIVTGGCGFIGSHIVLELNRLGFDRNIIIVDDFKESTKWKNLRQKKYGDFLSRYEFFEWLEDRPDEVKAIIHMGANSSTTGTNGDEYYDLNYRFTVELAKFTLEHGIRFIYASSAATYGDGSFGFSDNHEIIDLLSPLNLYGQTKQMADQWMLRNDAIEDVVGLKFFNVYGPYEAHKTRMASMCYHMYHQILKENKVRLFQSNSPLFGDGEQKRDFVYVKDVARITCEFLFNDLGGIYNVGTGEPRTFNDMAKALFVSMNRPVNIEYIPMPKDLEKSYQNYTKAEMEKLDSVMKLPYTTLEEGVKDYVQNYLLKGEGC